LSTLRIWKSKIIYIDTAAPAKIAKVKKRNHALQLNGLLLARVAKGKENLYKNIDKLCYLFLN
jgi:hypothetical protein